MAKAKRSWRLVIDASVTSAASPSADPTAGRCRDVLEAVLTICHRFVSDTEIRAEWSRHRSRFAHTWRRRMAARRKLAVVSETNVDEPLRQAILTTADTDRERQALAKDLHLVQAALATDGIILSRDKIVRGLLERAAIQVPELRKISWANPDEDAGLLQWLENGKLESSPYRLGGKRRAREV